MDEYSQIKLQSMTKTAQNFVNQTRDYIDLMVEVSEDEFPAMGDIIAKSGLATHKQLELMADKGYIKSLTIDIPSRLVSSKTVPAKAYYTERRVPKLVDAMLPQKQSIEIVRN